MVGTQSFESPKQSLNFVLKRLHILSLLLSVSACTKNTPDEPAPAPAADTHDVWVEYAMVGLESVGPTASLDLSATSGTDWQQTMVTPDPYSNGTTSKTINYKEVQNLVVSLTIPNKPAVVEKTAFLVARLVVDGKSQGEITMDKTFISNPGNYKAGIGATMALTMSTKDVK